MQVIVLIILFGMAVGGFFLWRWGLSYEKPKVFFSDVRLLQVGKKGWKERYAKTPYWLMNFSLILFVIAFLDLHYFVEKPSGAPSEGIALFLLVDRSGSMQEVVHTIGPRENIESIRKIDLMKELTKKFIEGRGNDLIGLIAFARTAVVLSPLTLDHEAVLEELSQVEAVKDSDQDGTAIGYAIYKGANLIAETRHYAEEKIGNEKPAYKIASSVLIVVTDGFHAPSPLDQNNPLRNIDPMTAAEYAKERNIRLYMVTIEPALASERFSAHRKLMQKASESTGGAAFMVDQGTSLQQIYTEIDKLEKSKLPTFAGDMTRERVSFYPFFLAVGMIALLLSCILFATVFRGLP